ncbi:uromodulin-like [Dendropsophus ebraccatus]|uniref:uromodulin-like n=1 Tax=Dendropsophus ebraccatus TaxID=150705 RepID=UPI0038320E01
MHSVLLTLVLLLNISLNISLRIDGVRSDDTEVTSICSDTYGFCSSLVCSSTNFTVTLNVKTLTTNSIDYKNLHLRDRRCTGFHYDNDKVTVTWPLGKDVCGNTLLVTEKYATYDNQIFLPPTGIIYRELYVLNVSCTYPRDYNVSLPDVVWPVVGITYIDVKGVGQFVVKMALYTDIDYKNQNTQHVVEISTRDYLYLKVYMEDPIPDFSLLMVNCFSTPYANPDYSPKYDLIINSCPNPAESTVKILQNGISTEGKFYVKAFKFVGDYSYVFIHCQVNLCEKSCEPTCSSSNRAAASVPEVQGTLTIGPFRMSGMLLYIMLSSSCNEMFVACRYLFIKVDVVKTYIKKANNKKKILIHITH